MGSPAFTTLRDPQSPHLYSTPALIAAAIKAEGLDSILPESVISMTDQTTMRKLTEQTSEVDAQCILFCSSACLGKVQLPSSYTLTD